MGFCGGTVSQAEKDASAASATLAKSLNTQAMTIMGNSSKVYQDLIGAFEPIAAAGIHQDGFDPATMATLKSDAITQTGVAGRNAMTAVKQANAAAGGGNAMLPGGAAIGAEMGTANAVAQGGAEDLSKIDLANKEQGQKNFIAASQGLAGAPNVFGVANNAANSATGAQAASNGISEDMTKVQNQPGWGMSLLSAAASLGGAAMTGGMSNLGKGVGFFGGDAPAPKAG